MSLITDLNSEPIECAICYEVIGPSNNCVTPCGHKFCFNCIVKCTKQNNNCPCCRGPLCEPPIDDEDDTEEEYDDEEEEYPEGEDEHNHTLEFGRVINDVYHSPVTINSIDDLASILDEQGASTDDTENWMRIMIGMFMKEDEPDFTEADDIEYTDEDYINELQKMEKIIEKEFKTFKKSLFLKKHFKKMIFHNKMMNQIGWYDRLGYSITK